MSNTVTAQPTEFILGTHNAKKCAELRALLRPLGISLRSLAEVENPIVVDETGSSFIENARMKAQQQARHLSQWTIGEDSGLCVPYLDGAPGIFSARYAGTEANDEANNDKLLRALESATSSMRAAYYVCTIAVSDPDGNIALEAEGKCWGRITKARRGAGGFGYDPLFEIPEYHRTFAEMGPAVKSVLSHRARALSRLMSGLQGLSR